MFKQFTKYIEVKFINWVFYVKGILILQDVVNMDLHCATNGDVPKELTNKLKISNNKLHQFLIQIIPPFNHLKVKNQSQKCWPCTNYLRCWVSSFFYCASNKEKSVTKQATSYIFGMQINKNCSIIILTCWA